MKTLELSYAEEIKIAHDAPMLVDRLSLILMACQLTVKTRQMLLWALNDQVLTESSDVASKLKRVQTAVFLIMVSPDYVIQR